MTDREDIIRMAREAWKDAGEGWVTERWFLDRAGALERFAALVAAAEREACSRAASIALLGADKSLSDRVVNAIRARGEK
jgi:hypothetical protein